jgi:HK97 family phage major capsid protein
MKHQPKMLPLMALMAAHFAAFQGKKASFGAAAYERRDDPTIKTVNEAIDKIANAFEEYKKTNDQRIENIKAGKGTAELDAKLAKMDEAINGLSEAKERLEKLEAKLARPGALSGSGEKQELAEAVEYRHAFVDWVRNPKDQDVQARCQQAAKALEQKEREQKKNDPREQRAAQVVTLTGSAGGFAVPEYIERQIQRLSVDLSPIRQIANVRTVGTVEFKELFDVNGSTFEWVGETDTRNTTNTPDLREVVPTFGMASAKPQASEESLDDLFFDVESWLIESASEAIAQGEGAAFIAGNGTKKPTGFLAGPTPVVTGDATRAFGTLQYIASGQAAALPSNPDVFTDMVYGVRARYRTNARWVTNRLVLAALRKYKDTNGQYLWQPSLSASQPATFQGYGITEAEDMPAIAANSFPLAFGDFREGYLIADRVGLRMTRDEITTPGFVKFYIRKRVGGILRNSQAIKLLKVAAA